MAAVKVPENIACTTKDSGGSSICYVVSWSNQVPPNFSFTKQDKDRPPDTDEKHVVRSFPLHNQEISWAWRTSLRGIVKICKACLWWTSKPQEVKSGIGLKSAQKMTAPRVHNRSAIIIPEQKVPTPSYLHQSTSQQRTQYGCCQRRSSTRRRNKQGGATHGRPPHPRDQDATRSRDHGTSRPTTPCLGIPPPQRCGVNGHLRIARPPTHPDQQTTTLVAARGATDRSRTS